MLIDYINAAAAHAVYELLAEDGEYYGEIPPCAGVHATGTTLEACRAELLSTLEDWVLFRIHRHLSLPVIDGIELTADTKNIAAIRQEVCMVFQQFNLFPHLTVAGNVAFGLRRDVPQREARVDALLEKVNLTGFGA